MQDRDSKFADLNKLCERRLSDFRRLAVLTEHKHLLERSLFAQRLMIH